MSKKANVQLRTLVMVFITVFVVAMVYAFFLLKA